VPEYLQIRSNGQITLPAATRRQARIKEGDLLEVTVDAYGTIHLIPKIALDRSFTITSQPFSDTFVDSGTGKWTPYGGTWEIVDGHYTVDAGPGYKSVVNSTNYSSFTIEADLMAKGGDTGLIFRASNFAFGRDIYNGYYAGIDTNGSVVLWKADNGWTQLGASPTKIKESTWYHIKVVASGTLIQVYLTDMDTPKIMVTDTRYNCGAIGLRTYNSTSKFKNLTAKSTFHDDFNHGTKSWTAIEGNWSIVDGKYNVNAGSGFKSIATDTNFDDFTYEVDVNIAGKEGDSGVIFRGSSFTVGVDSYFGYYAGLEVAGRVVLGLTKDIGWITLSAVPMTIPTNAWIHMKVVAAGSSIKVYVTDMDTPKITLTDSTYSSGSIGLRTYHTKARFGAVNVY
jgi:AbrB family looped-hinge helix DNA binding protein